MGRHPQLQRRIACSNTTLKALRILPARHSDGVPFVKHDRGPTSMARGHVQARQPHDTAAQVGGVSTLQPLDESAVGGHQGALGERCQGQIEAVLGGMIQARGQGQRLLHERRAFVHPQWHMPEQAFDDKLHTLRGNAVHNRVNQVGNAYIQGMRVEPALPLWTYELGLIGKAEVGLLWARRRVACLACCALICTRMARWKAEPAGRHAAGSTHRPPSPEGAA